MIDKSKTTLKMEENFPYRGGDLVSCEITIFPKWWQFWKKPEKKMVLYKCEATNGF